MNWGDRPPWEQANRLMWSFNYDKRLAAWIWAARLRDCDTCGMPPHEPCVNLTDVRRADLGKIPLENIRRTKWPHSKRVDWMKLYTTLYARGYRPETQKQRYARQQAKLDRLNKKDHVS